MAFRLSCPRYWRSPNHILSDFQNRVIEFQQYIPPPYLHNVQIHSVLPVDSKSKARCKWQVTFDYHNPQVVGNFKFVKIVLNQNLPRNARIQSIDRLENNMFMVTYIVNCTCEPLDFSKADKTGLSASEKKKHQPVAEMSINGGCVVAMRGKDCVAIATDHRFGVQAQTIATDFEKVNLGLGGIQSDIRTVMKRFGFMLSSFLYEKRFGLHPVTFEPFICNMDLIGCTEKPDDFVVSGTCSEQLYGMCETLWKPDLQPDDLFECISQAMVNVFDRDAMSGWGATVYIIEKDKITAKTLKTRMD